MNNRSDKHTKLLAETFHGEWDTGAPARFAQAAASAARRRQFARRSLHGAGALAVLGIALWLAREKTTAPSSAVDQVATSAPRRGYEIISDDELLAQVRDQP